MLKTEMGMMMIGIAAARAGNVAAAMLRADILDDLLALMVGMVLVLIAKPVCRHL